jgi:hypothetical protein
MPRVGLGSQTPVPHGHEPARRELAGLTWANVDLREGDPVHARCARIGAGHPVGVVENVLATDLVVEHVEAEGGFRPRRPSIPAVLRLMRSSNLVGCSIGTSAGLAPFKTLSAISAARRNTSYALGRRVENQSHGGCH